MLNTVKRQLMLLLLLLCLHAFFVVFVLFAICCCFNQLPFLSGFVGSSENKKTAGLIAFNVWCVSTFYAQTSVLCVNLGLSYSYGRGMQFKASRYGMCCVVCEVVGGWIGVIVVVVRVVYSVGGVGGVLSG